MMTRNINGVNVALSADEEAAVLAEQAANLTALNNVTAARAAVDALDAQFAGDTNRQDIVSKLQGATPAQILNWVNTNVTDLTSAKLVMAKILLLVARTIKT